MTDFVDFGAALPARAQAQVAAKSRAQARTEAANKPKRAARKRGQPNSNILEVNNLMPLDDNNMLLGSNTKGHRQLDAKETLFLLNWLPGKMTKKMAMKKAGYSYDKDVSMYSKAANIIKRYEAAAQDKANIFRDVGIGEAQVAQNIKQLAEKSGSEIVRLQANALAAKALRLTDAPPPSHTGIQIVVNTIVQAAPDSQGSSRAPGREGTTVIHVQPGEVDQDAKPLQITR
jgi:hypothetical protein